MYINPFWAGVIATVLVEVALIIGYGIVATMGGKKK